MPTLAGGATRAKGSVEIVFKAVGLVPLTAQVDKAFANMSGRASYYAGMIQSRLGFAFLGASAAIVGFMGIATKKFAEFDQAMKNTASVTNATIKEISMLSEYAQELGMMGTASAKDVASAMYFLGSAGYETGEIFKAIQPIMKLSVATQSDMADTARITMQSLKAFGKEAESADRFTRVFAAGIASSQLRIEWLGSSLKHLGPVAHEVGMSIEETTAALAMLHDVGIQAGMAGRHLRRMIQGTVKDSNQANKVLEKYDLTLKDISIRAHGFGDVIKLLHDKQVNLGEVFKLFGLRASASAAGIMRMSKSWDEYLQNVKDVTKLQKMYDTQMQGMQAQFKRLANTVTVFMMKFAESYAPIILGITRVFTEMFAGLSHLPKWQYQMLAWVSVITAVGLAFMGLTMILRGMLTQGMMTFAFWKKVIYVTFVGSIRTMLTLLEILRKKMLVVFLNLFTRATHSIGELGVAIRTLKHHTVGNWLKNFAISISGVTKSFLTISAILGLITVIVLAGIATWKNYEESIKSWARESSNAIKIFKTDLVNLINETKTIPQRIQETIQKLAVPEWLKTYLKWATERKKLLEKGLEAKGILLSKEKLDEEKQILKDALVDVKEQFKDAGKDTMALLDSIIDKLGNKLPGVLGGLSDVWNGILPKWEDDLVGLNESTDATITSLGEKVESFTDNLETKWTNTVFELIKGTKTWQDVWRMVLDNALQTFIQGFIQEMLKAWGGAIAKMAIGAHNFQADLGKNLLKLAPKVLGIIGGISAGAGGLATAASTIGSYDPVPMPGFSFAKGTDYVPRDMVAQIHKGEAIIPANENKGQELTIVNVIDPSFVPAGLARDPNVVINIINDDVIMAGSTRRTMRRYLG